MERCLIYERLKSAKYCNTCVILTNTADTCSWSLHGPTGTWDFVPTSVTPNRHKITTTSQVQAEMGQFRGRGEKWCLRYKYTLESNRGPKNHVLFCLFFFDTVKATDPCHTDTTWHKNKHTHKKIHIYTFKSLPSQQCMNIEIVYTASVENLVDQVHTSVNDMFWRLVAANKIRGNFIINCGMLYYENLLI